MAKKKIEETQPTPIQGAASQFPEQIAAEPTLPAETALPEASPEPRKRRKIGRWILLGILIVVVAGAFSSMLAYTSGINARKSSETQARLTKAAEHFQFGLQMMDQKKYDLATVQFAYVIQLDPSFPGVVEKMTEAQMKVIESKQPTAVPTSMITATPDTRGVDELFVNAQQSIQNADWEQGLHDLETLRNADVTYKMVEVDGMYYTILRSLGVQQIFGTPSKGITGGQLEEGIFNLYLASKFAPLDKDALTAREWARRYISAAASWGVNWPTVIDQFQVIYQAYPYMTDINGKTAFARYAMALAYYGQQLFDKGDYCPAVKKYQAANAVFQQYNRTPPDDIGDLMKKITIASNKCEGPAPTKKATSQPTSEATQAPTAEVPTDTPVPTETPTP
jgi:hypothetical protein